MRADVESGFSRMIEVRRLGTVPYAEALTQVLGPGSGAALVEQLAEQADAMRAHGRSLFSRWLEAAVRAQRRSLAS